MSKTAGQVRPEKLRDEHRQRVAEVRADNTLSWEKKELTIRQMGLRLDKRLKELEEER